MASKTLKVGGGFVLTYLATKGLDWTWDRIPGGIVSSLASLWEAIRFPALLALAYFTAIGLWWLIRDYIRLRRWIRGYYVVAFQNWLNDGGRDFKSAADHSAVGLVHAWEEWTRAPVEKGGRGLGAKT